MPKCFTPLFFLFLITACNQQPSSNNKTAPSSVVIHVNANEDGTITDTLVVKQLQELAQQVSNKGDKIMLNSYTERMQSDKEAMTIATRNAEAAKEVMSRTGLERIYYNVGIDAHGAVNFLPGIPENSAQNRRIEVQVVSR
ncbi:MAG: hypothetical protein U0V74_16890 [Chitinophagales bacterium]